MRKVCSDTSKVKVTVEGQVFILVWSITSTFINGFQNNFAHVSPETNTSVMRKVCFDLHMVKVTVESQMIKMTLSRAPVLHLSMDFKKLHTLLVLLNNKY